MKPPARQLPPRPIPLRPDPAASDEAVMRSLSRAVIASGLAATDRKIDLAVYPRSAWPSDRDVPRILRTAMQPHSTDNIAALIAVGIAFLSALKPASAGADLLGRGLQLTFENRTTSITVPGTQPAERAIHRRDEAIPVGEGVGPGVRLHPHKIGIIAVASNEMLKIPRPRIWSGRS